MNIAMEGEESRGKCYHKVSRKTLVLFKHIIYEPQEFPLEATLVSSCRVVSSRGFILSLYDVIIINSYHHDSNQRRYGLEIFSHFFIYFTKITRLQGLYISMVTKAYGIP